MIKIGGKIVLFAFLLAACNTDFNQIQTVKVRTENFPNSINYLTSSSNIGGIIQRKTFNLLLSTADNLKRKPLAVKSLPLVSKEGTEWKFEYEIRPEAKWDDGSSITYSDIEFSLKAFKLPMDKNKLTSIYYDRINGLKKDTTNFKKFTLIGSGNVDDLIGLTGDFGIMQKSKFDPKNLLSHLTLDEIVKEPEKIKIDAKAISFLDNFISDNYKYNGEYFHSSGAYKISHIELGQYIKLVKNRNWWGHTMVNDRDYINANPDEITYFSIPETLNAVHSLKNGEIDVMGNIPANEFIQLEADSGFNQKFNLSTPLNFRFTYIGINSRKDPLNKKGLRQALSHLFNKENIINTVERGYAEATVGPVNPALSYYYNDKIPSTTYSHEAAENLLLENGLTKKNEGWFDKKTKQPFELSFIYSQSGSSEAIAQIFKSAAEKIGLKINLIAYESRALYKKIYERDYDIFIGSLTGSPFSFNFSEIFGTEAAQMRGMNHTGFGNAKSDSLIYAINHAADSVERRDALFGLQEILHDEATMIFLYFSKNKIAISKKFTNLKISSLKPGYDVTAFKLAEEVQ